MKKRDYNKLIKKRSEKHFQMMRQIKSKKLDRNFQID